ncbi:YjeF N-terminal domain-containing protein [Kockiozyma suomiensis]|uniref:YjeF N-terminal domain-containing protein n=1 Tax=Kockiozyma suomiensis TaxID=1337062 RepID=UPI0033442C7A
MAEYVGLKVSVKLQNGTTFTGIVSEINGTKLRLINVFDTSTGTHVPSRVIDGSKIADLQIIAPQADIIAQKNPLQKKKRHQAPPNAQSGSPAPFQDPAIMAMPFAVSSNTTYAGTSFSASPSTVSRLPNAGNRQDQDETESEESSSDPSDTLIQIYGGSPRPSKNPKKIAIAKESHRREPSATHVPRPFAGKGKKGKRTNGEYYDDSWAAEDTAGFKDTEFDFQGNLNKFNKKNVFDEIRQADTTDPTERLISFNRKDGLNAVSAHQAQQDHIRELLKRPPKKDFLPTENVLSTKSAAWQGLSESEDEDETELSVQAGEEVSDIDNEIRLQQQQQQHRRISQARALSRASSHGGTPPVYQYESPPRRLLYDTGERSAFTCPTFTTEHIAAVEQAATTLYSMHSIQLTENAGAAVAKLAISILGGKRRFEKRHTQVNALPVVVVLAGNHNTGARAIAGARMLVNRRVRVVVLFTDDSTELASPKESIESQLRAFKAAGGKTTSRLDVLQATLRVLDAPPELIIDALTGINSQSSAGGGGVPGWMYEAAQFSASQRAPVLAIDVPAGVNPATGAVMVNNMGRAKWLLCLGMPSVGIPHYMQHMDEVLQSELDVAVADIGLPSRCFKKVLAELGEGEAFKDGVVFGSEWAIPVKLAQA